MVLQRLLLVGAIIFSLINLESSLAAGRACSIVVSSLRNVASSSEVKKSRARNLNSVRYTPIFDVAARVVTRSGALAGESLLKAVSSEAGRQSLRENSRMYDVPLVAKLPASEGGGELRLVVLNQRRSNLAYNHVELTTLLEINPELANSIGFYKSTVDPNLVWVPDETTVNFRITNLAKQRGFLDLVWTHEAVEGVVDTIPYLQLLSKGKFPFSNASDMNLAVHDAVHAFAFAVLNITSGGRRALEAAKSRNQVIVKIASRLHYEIGPDVAELFVKREVQSLSPDSMERTMLLTILLSGNYDYFSAFEVRNLSRPRFFTPQNSQTLKGRLENLLRLLNYGHKTFDSSLEAFLPRLKLSQREAVTKIFKEETSGLIQATEAEISKGAKELINFFPPALISESAPIRTKRNAVSENHDPAGPETLVP